MGLLNRPNFESSESEGQEGTSTSRTVATPNNSAAKPKTASAPPGPSTRMKTGVIRGSYVSIFKAKAAAEDSEDQTPKYEMTLLIPKSDKQTLDKMEACMEEAINVKWPNKRPAKVEISLHDGDGVRPQSGEPFGEECKGHMVLVVKSKFRPEVRDRNRDEIMDASLARSGDYFKVSINFYGYEKKGRRGVAAGLNNVLFWERGESLSGATSAEDDFADDFVDA